MVPAAVVDKHHRRLCCRCSKPGDILIDGGNSYYVDDIRRAKELSAEGNPLRRRRHQRRRLGPGARLLHDDRRRGRGREAPRPDLQDARARRGRHSAHARPREDRAAPPSTAICTAGRTAPAISSRWSTTASSTASWPPMPKGSDILRAANIGKKAHAIDAETTPLRDPEHYQYDLNLPDIAEVWRRGSVIASWLLDLTATALGRRPAIWPNSPGRVSDSGEGPLDDQGRHRRGRARARADHRALRALRVARRGRLPDKLLSAMRYQFGGHVEKPAGK